VDEAREEIMNNQSLEVPVKRCNKCKNVIPRNGDVVGGKTIKRPRLICEWCARAATPPYSIKPVSRLRKGEKAEGQGSFLDEVPAIFIGRKG
jgi:hypothetical protein